MTSQHPRRSTYVAPAVAWLGACFVADVDEGLDATEFVAGSLIRAASTLAVAAGIRWMYVQNHPGRVVSPELLWIAALFAALLALGRLAA